MNVALIHYDMNTHVQYRNKTYSHLGRQKPAPELVTQHEGRDFPPIYLDKHRDSRRLIFRHEKVMEDKRKGCSLVKSVRFCSMSIL